MKSFSKTLLTLTSALALAGMPGKQAGAIAVTEASIDVCSFADATAYFVAYVAEMKNIVNTEITSEYAPAELADNATTKEEGSHLFTAALDDSDLNENRGTAGLDIATLAVNEAHTSNNAITGNSITGNNAISDAAFQNSQGFTSVIQNTGNLSTVQVNNIINVSLGQ